MIEKQLRRLLVPVQRGDIQRSKPTRTAGIRICAVGQEQGNEYLKDCGRFGEGNCVCAYLAAERKKILRDLGLAGARGGLQDWVVDNFRAGSYERVLTFTV